MVHGRKSLCLPGPRERCCSRTTWPIAMFKYRWNALDDDRSLPGISKRLAGFPVQWQCSVCLPGLLAGWRARLPASGWHSPGETRRVIICRSASTDGD